MAAAAVVVVALVAVAMVAAVAAVAATARRCLFCGEVIEEEQTQEMKDRLLRVDLQIRVVACSTARGAHRLSQTMS